MLYELTDWYIKYSPKTLSWCVIVKIHGTSLVWIDTDTYTSARSNYKHYTQHIERGECRCDGIDTSKCVYKPYLKIIPGSKWYEFFD